VKKRGKPKNKARARRTDNLARAQAAKPPVAPSARNNRAAIAYSADDGRALALLLLPFLIVSVFLGINHTMKPAIGWTDAARSRPAVASPESLVTAMLERTPLALPSAAPEGLRRPASLAPAPVGAIELPPIQLPREAPQIARSPADLPRVADFSVPVPVGAIELPPIQLPKDAPQIAGLPANPPRVANISVPVPPFALPAGPPKFETADIVTPPGSTAAVPEQVALILPPPAFALPATAPLIAEPGIAGPGNTSTSEVCRPAAKRVPVVSPASAKDFGSKLADAALAQINDFVIYNATYKRIAYPMGDIPSLYGSCSDVVIRAYRALGVDLQELVQRARLGSGDPSIDHRRTETLRMFFSRYGNVLPVSAFPEDYKPGDIVTYYRPFSRVSRAHIAIVSSELGSSGRPMIVHNRGWGPQLEDALFVDRITGHYRFSGAAQLAAQPSIVPRGGLSAVQRSSLLPLSGVKPRGTRVAVKSE
jgi:uncharacterized protein YijF (DUF1287 family)